MQTTLQRRLLVGLVLVAAGLLLWAVLRDGADSPEQGGESVAVAADDVPDALADVGHPVYWVGERPNVRYELTHTAAGRVYVRYLEDEGAKAGDPRPRFLTVGTYPVVNGIAALRRAARRNPGGELGRTDDGAVVLINPDNPNSVHLAYPGSSQQVEVYSPDPDQALRSVIEGKVEPVSGS